MAAGSSDTAQAYGAIIAAFLSGCVAHIIPWLMASTAVILCDLVTGLRKSWLLGEEIRFSKACRRTMGKVATYFAFVVTVCFVNQAAGGEYGIDKWSCLFVCLVEGFSIFDNIFEPKGIRINLANALNALFRKAAKMDVPEGIFEDGKGDNDNDKEKEGNGDGRKDATTGLQAE